MYFRSLILSKLGSRFYIYLVGNPLQRTNKNHRISISKDISVFQGYLNQGYAWGRHVSLNKYLLTCSSALPGTLLAWTVYLAAPAPRPLWRRAVCSPETLISSPLSSKWRGGFSHWPFVYFMFKLWPACVASFDCRLTLFSWISLVGKKRTIMKNELRKKVKRKDKKKIDMERKGGNKGERERKKE